MHLREKTKISEACLKCDFTAFSYDEAEASLGTVYSKKAYTFIRRLVQAAQLNETWCLATLNMQSNDLQSIGVPHQVGVVPLPDQN